MFDYPDFDKLENYKLITKGHRKNIRHKITLVALKLFVQVLKGNTSFYSNEGTVIKPKV